MNTYKFKRLDEDSLIIVETNLGTESLSLALDTGASHTVIDLSAVLLAGYEMKDVVRIVELETGKGSIDAYVFKIDAVSSLGVIHKNMEVCSYDFFANNLLSDIHGVLGLDFFKDRDLYISFKRSEILVT